MATGLARRTIRSATATKATGHCTSLAPSDTDTILTGSGLDCAVAISSKCYVQPDDGDDVHEPYRSCRACYGCTGEDEPELARNGKGVKAPAAACDAVWPNGALISGRLCTSCPPGSGWIAYGVHVQQTSFACVMFAHTDVCVCVCVRCRVTPHFTEASPGATAL